MIKVFENGEDGWGFLTFYGQGYSPIVLTGKLTGNFRE